MVGVVLGVVVLNEELRPLHSIIMRFAALSGSCPCEMKLILGCILDPFEFFICNLASHAIHIFMYDVEQHLLLVRVQFLHRNAMRIQSMNFAFCSSNNF